MNSEQAEHIQLLNSQIDKITADYNESIDQMKKEINELTIDKDSFCKDVTILREDILYYKEKCVIMNENITDIAEKFKESRSVIEECFEDLRQMNVEFSRREDYDHDDRIKDIKGNMDYIAGKFKDNHFQLEEYYNKMNNLRSEFSKLINSMKAKENELQNRDSEISQLRLQNEKMTAQIEKREDEINKLRHEYDRVGKDVQNRD